MKSKNPLKATPFFVVLGISATLVTSAIVSSDVPDTHWAHNAVKRMKEQGVLLGFPDGTFRGKESVTRYELASSLDQIYTNLSEKDYQLESRQDELRSLSGGGPSQSAFNDLVRASQEASRKIEDTQETLQRSGTAVNELRNDSEDLKKQLVALEEALTSMIPDEGRESLNLSTDPSRSIEVGQTLKRLGLVAKWFNARLKKLEEKAKIQVVPFPKE